MKMKLYFASAIMALSWMGCNQEEVVNESMGNANTICAIIEGTSRSTVTDAGKFSWADDDQISVLDATNKDIYTYSGSGNDFTLSGTKNVNEPVVAYYPAHESHTTTSFYLPNSYGDDNTEYVADTHAAMIATPPTEGDTYAFMHLGGVMRFNVKNVPVGTTQFSLTISDKNIHGSFDVKGNEGIKTIETSDGSNSVVSIKFSALTEAKDMTFYVPLPTGTYSNYTVSLTGSFGYKNYLSTDVNNTISRRTLLLMPTFTYDAADGGKLVKGEAVDNVIKLVDGNAEATITDDGDVVVTPGNNADATATLNYTPSNDGTSTLAISDGSAEGTESSDSQGKVVVETASGTTVASCDIDAPTLSVTLSADNDAEVTYKEVTALTAQQTLIIGKGITVETLKLKGGNVIIEEGATVTTIQNADGFTGKTYIVSKGALTYSPSVNNIIIVSNESEMALRVAAEYGGTVVLKEDVTLAETLTIAAGKDVTLDLNTHTLLYISDVQNESMILNNGTLTVKNGTVTYQYTGAADNTNSKGNYAINNTGKLIVEANINAVAGTVGTKFAHPFYAINTSGETIIKSGKILNNTNIAIRQWVGSEDKSSDITVEGGEIEGLRAIWIQLPGSETTKAPLGNLTIKKGTLTGTAIDGTEDSGYVNAIYAYSYGNQMKNVKINIYNGDIYGDLQLTGGRSGAKEDVERVTIEGGTFHGHNGERVFGVVSWAADNLASEAITITGGTFYHPYPLNYMEGDNGTIDIKLARDLSYEDNDGQEDNKLIVVPAGNTVTLDLNGKTISRTSTTPVFMITNNGNLTIKDSSNGSGKIAYTFNGTVNNGAAANTIRNNGKLTVEGGEISNTGTGGQIGYAIDNYNGATLTVDGGKITASGSSSYDGIRLFCGSTQTTVTVNNGEISTIWAQNPSDSKATEVRGTVIINGGTVGTTYYERFTTVKVKSGVTATVNPYGEGYNDANKEEKDGYICYSFNIES